jgi:DNA-binding transcriptional ArsR family regulator
MAAERAAEATAEEERLEISEIGALKAMADPLRLRLLLSLSSLSEGGAKTVKELAALFGVPQTRLYYHVRMLQEAGLIRVAARRMVSGIEERRYAAVATNFGVAPELLSSPALSDLLKAMFDLTRAELMLALAEPSAVPGDPSGSVPILTFNRMFFMPDDLAKFQGRMIDAFDEFAGDARPGAVEYGGAFALYRVGVGSSPTGDTDAP